MTHSFNWSHQTVLVTGAGGFIGSHLTEKLVELGAHTRALVHYNSLGTWGWLDQSVMKDDMELIAGDVCDRDIMRKAVKGIDVVFHLAALIAIPYSYQAPSSFIRTNIEGTLNVLQSSLEANVKKIVHTSTSEVYGSAQYVPIDEKHPLQGQSPYSASKIGADKLAESFHLSFGLPVATIRPFNTYGPRQSARAIIPTIITQALKKSEVHLGNIKPTRDLNYVSDIVEGYVLMAACPEVIGRTVNIGSGFDISMENLAYTILKLMGKDIPLINDDDRKRLGDSEVERLCADNTLAQNMLGWSSQCRLEDGLIRTIEWIKDNLERYRPGMYVI